MFCLQMKFTSANRALYGQLSNKLGAQRVKNHVKLIATLAGEQD